MADKFLNITGLTYYHNRLKNEFGSKSTVDTLVTDVDTLEQEVADLITEGGEPNVIETVKVNGTALVPDAQKAVDVTVPTKTSDLENDGTGNDDVYASIENDLTNKSISISANGSAGLSFLPTTEGLRVSYSDENEETYNKNLATTDYVNQNGGKIDTISVNGTQQTITNKNVDITVPTKTSDLTNDSHFVTDALGENAKLYSTSATAIEMVNPNGDALNFNSNSSNNSVKMKMTIDASTVITNDLATTQYVDQNGGKIDKIQVNGTEQTITNKTVNITVPTKVSDITNDSNFQTETQVDAKIASSVASVVTLKGSVATYNDLPSTGQKHGDMYDTLDTGANYVWLVEEGTGRWDPYAGVMDLSAYWISTTGQTNTLEAITTAEIDAIINPSA